MHVSPENAAFVPKYKAESCFLCFQTDGRLNKFAFKCNKKNLSCLNLIYPEFKRSFSYHGALFRVYIYMLKQKKQIYTLISIIRLIQH